MISTFDFQVWEQQGNRFSKEGRNRIISKKSIFRRRKTYLIGRLQKRIGAGRTCGGGGDITGCIVVDGEGWRPRRRILAGEENQARLGADAIGSRCEGKKTSRLFIRAK